MHRTSLAVVFACLALGAVTGAAVPAFASGGAPTDIIAVNQDPDGTLWYKWDWARTSETFITSKPCWVDHDHIRLGGWGHDGCLSSRP